MAQSDESMFLGNGRGGEFSDLPPSEEQISKAIEGSQSGGKVMKVLYLDDKGESVGEWASSQVPENPFAGQMSGLQEPPFRLEQLLYLAESHPVHSAAIEQKTVDIVGKGWSWDPVDEDAADEDARDALETWLQSLAPDDVDVHEILHSAWLDVETVGWGTIEVARDLNDVVQRVYHVPGHTVRAHRDGFRLCQIRDARKVWFRRWGCPDINGERVVVDARTGSKNPLALKVPANDLLVIKKPSRRSTWYGIPGYISSVGYITLALAARDDNLFWFANRREPRWAIVLSGLADDPNVQEDLRRAFVVDMKQPYRNLMIPISGPGKVEFNKLSDTKTDGSFAQLAERADKAIMISHRVPGERLANSQVGPLGGNATAAASRVYKDGVVAPSQELLNKRLNRFIEVEYPKVGQTKREDGTITPKTTPSRAAKTTTPVGWRLKLDDLDVDDDREDLDMTVIAFHGNVINLGEARAKLGLGPLMKKIRPPKPEAPVDPVTGLPDPTWEPPVPKPVAVKLDEKGKKIPEPEYESEYNDMLFTELPGSQAQAGQPGRVPIGTGGLDKSRVELASLEKAVRILYTSAKEGHENLERLTGDLKDAVEEQREQRSS